MSWSDLDTCRGVGAEDEVVKAVLIKKVKQLHYCKAGAGQAGYDFQVLPNKDFQNGARELPHPAVPSPVLLLPSLKQIPALTLLGVHLYKMSSYACQEYSR